MNDKRYQKWLIFLYLFLVLIGIIILVCLGITNIASWSVLYSWLLGIPFGVAAIVSYTLIPKILIKYATKKTRKSNLISFIGVLLYVTRYFFYLIPFFIVLGFNGINEADGALSYYGALVVLVVPLSSIIMNYLLFWLDFKNISKKGVKNVASGDSLSPN